MALLPFAVGVMILESQPKKTFLFVPEKTSTTRILTLLAQIVRRTGFFLWSSTTSHKNERLCHSHKLINQSTDPRTKHVIFRLVNWSQIKKSFHVIMTFQFICIMNLFGCRN